MATKKELLARNAQLEAEIARLMRRLADLYDQLHAKEPKRTREMRVTRQRIMLAARKLKDQDPTRSWLSIAKEFEFDTEVNPKGLPAETIYRHYLKGMRR